MADDAFNAELQRVSNLRLSPTDQQKIEKVRAEYTYPGMQDIIKKSLNAGEISNMDIRKMSPLMVQLLKQMLQRKSTAATQSAPAAASAPSASTRSAPSGLSMYSRSPSKQSPTALARGSTEDANLLAARQSLLAAMGGNESALLAGARQSPLAGFPPGVVPLAGSMPNESAARQSPLAAMTGVARQSPLAVMPGSASVSVIPNESTAQKSPLAVMPNANESAARQSPLAAMTGAAPLAVMPNESAARQSPLAVMPGAGMPGTARQSPVSLGGAISPKAATGSPRAKAPSNEPLPNEYIKGDDTRDLSLLTRPYAPHSRLAVQAIGQFPEIPSIHVRNSKTGVVQNCKEWFASRLQNPNNLPSKTSVAGAYMDADGNADLQKKRQDEIIRYICDHDVNARRIMETVGRTIRALLKKTLMIPQLLAENARLCSCSVRPDLVDDQRLLMEQLAYMAMQMKRLTDSLDFSYDPATQKFYRMKSNGEMETMDQNSLHPILGLDASEVKELWDVLSSSQTGELYGQKLDIYPEHKACDGTMVRTQMFNIILHYIKVPAELAEAAAAGPTNANNIAVKDAMGRAYLLRLWELSAPTSEAPGSTETYKMSYNQDYANEIYPLADKLRPYIGVIPSEENGVRIFVRIPQDFFETNAPNMSTSLAAVIGPGIGNDIKQLALTSLAIRAPKISPNATGADSWLAQASTDNKKVDIAFMTYDELDPTKFDPPGIIVD